MFSSFYLFLFCQTTLCFIKAFGGNTTSNPSNPLQSLLSISECFKFEQEGCKNRTYFLDKEEFKNCSTAYNGSARAATRIYLFTDNPDDPELLHHCGGEPPDNTKLDPSKPVLIIFPGFISGFCHMSVYREMIRENFRCRNRTIIAIEWTWGNSFDLVTARENMKIVACQIRTLIGKLKANYNLTEESFTCMGHSLGAHGCGLIGKREKIYSIHGLDPAGVAYWESKPPDKRLNETLDRSDAKQVQVTHCNAGQCLFVKEPGNIFPQTYFGINYTCGTTDVWYNGGKHQWGCYPQIIYSLLKGDILYALITLYPAACHHLQCLYYYKANMCPEKDPMCPAKKLNCNYIGVNCTNPLEKLQSESDKKPVDANPITVNPVTIKNPPICGKNCENCTIVGANYNASDHIDGHKNYCTNTTRLCDYCDRDMYKEVKKQCCDNGIKPGLCSPQ